jgi:hypothetical protein
MNLESGEELDDINPLDRIGVVFGHNAQNIQVSYFEWTAPRTIVKYNYFEGLSSDFYTRISTDTITMYHDPVSNGYRYIWTDIVGTQKECVETKTVRGSRCDAEPHNLRIPLHKWKPVGEFTVRCGLRRDPNIFDEDAPKDPDNCECRKGITIDSHTRECIGSPAQHEGFIAEFKLIRNGQLIGTIPLVDVKGSSARGNYVSLIRYCLVQCEVSFSPMSSHENHMDLAMQIQENKNQLHGDALPLSFRRLLKHIRSNKADVILNYFRNCYNTRVISASISGGGSACGGGSLTTSNIEANSAATISVVSPATATDESESVIAPATATDESESVLAPATATDESESEDTPTDDSPIPTPLPVSPITIVEHEEEDENSITGTELQALLQCLATKINPTKIYADPTLLQLFNQLQQCNRIL